MNGRKGLRALGLSLLAVFGLMAFMAAGAQAGWLILLGAVTDELKAGEVEEVQATQHVDGILLVPGALNLEILCHEISSNDILLIGSNNSALADATGKVLFNNCLTSTITPLTRAAKCDPVNQPIEAAGKAHIILHSGKNYVLFEPTTGLSGVFTVVKFGAECALVEDSEITGQLVAECGHLSGGVFVGLDCKTHQTTGLLRQAPAALFPSDKLQFGEQNATLDGIAAVTLSGKNAGAGWGGHV